MIKARIAVLAFGAALALQPAIAQSVKTGLNTFKAVAFSGAGQSVPSNCNTAQGEPCTAVTWNDTGCAATVIESASGIETSGPCGIAILRCTGSCASTTLPALPTAGTTLSANSQWSILSSTIAETSSSGGPYYDTTVNYGSTYTYVAVAWWTGAGGGVVSPYSATFQVQIGAAPGVAPPAPTGGAAVKQ